MSDLMEDMWEFLKLTRKHIFSHFFDFWFIWALLILMLIISIFSHFSMWVVYSIYILTGLYILYTLIWPMATVYSLVGCSASIRTFLMNFFLITFLFSNVYYCLFFKDAGFCYDGNTPVLDYTKFKNVTGVNIITQTDTIKTLVSEERLVNGVAISEKVIQTRVDTIKYHNVTYCIVLKNSFMTSLTQGPSDFFFIISDFGEGMNTCTSDSDRTSLFSVILTIHVLISWLFLGVLISMLYSKFRYEA